MRRNKGPDSDNILVSSISGLIQVPDNHTPRLSVIIETLNVSIGKLNSPPLKKLNIIFAPEILDAWGTTSRWFSFGALNAYFQGRKCC